jgi:hypothetical protein
MARSAVAEDHRLHERGPAEIVDVVERRAGADQLPHHAVMPEMRRRDQCRAVIDAGDELRARAVLEERLHHRRVVAHGGDRHGVVALAVEKGGIGSCVAQQRAGGVAMALEGRDVQGRAVVAVARVRIGAGGRKSPDFRDAAASRRGVQIAIGSELGRARRRLCQRRGNRCREHRREPAGQGQASHRATLHPCPDAQLAGSRASG